MNEKEEKLKELLQSYGKLAIGFSSGVDSTYLLRVASEVLGDDVIAITASARFFPSRELDEAKAFCEQNHIRHIIVEIDEAQIGGFAQNPKNRCYLCKYNLFSQFLQVAKEHGIDYVAEASNMDDNGDYRPGLIAVAELGIKSPLREVGMTKAQIRQLSKMRGLATWEKPSYACLASRFVYGETISASKLSMVEQAEEYLRNLGFSQLRVRVHGMLARIEVEEREFEKLMEPKLRSQVYARLKEIGFAYITVDLLGYRTGSMNETLTREEIKRNTQSIGGGSNG